jgi:hypothetical protein
MPKQYRGYGQQPCSARTCGRLGAFMVMRRRSLQHQHGMSLQLCSTVTTLTGADAVAAAAVAIVARAT